METRTTSSLESEPTTVTKLLSDTDSQKITNSAPSEDWLPSDQTSSGIAVGGNDGDVADVAESCVGNGDNKIGRDSEGQPIRDVAEQNISANNATDSQEQVNTVVKASETVHECRSLGSEEHPPENFSVCQQTAEQGGSGNKVILSQPDVATQTKTGVTGGASMNEPSNGAATDSQKRSTGTDLIMLNYRGASSSDSESSSEEESSSTDSLFSSRYCNVEGVVCSVPTVM